MCTKQIAVERWHLILWCIQSFCPICFRRGETEKKLATNNKKNILLRLVLRDRDSTEKRWKRKKNEKKVIFESYYTTFTYTRAPYISYYRLLTDLTRHESFAARNLCHKRYNRRTYISHAIIFDSCVCFCIKPNGIKQKRNRNREWIVCFLSRAHSMHRLLLFAFFLFLYMLCVYELLFFYFSFIKKYTEILLLPRFYQFCAV